MSEPVHKPFLGVHFVYCKVYGRLYLNKAKDGYEGRCPKCGQIFKVRIGSEGSHERFFKAYCTRSYL